MNGLSPVLPAGIQVLERGWLSSNNVLLTGESHAALIDSGYCTHSEQTLALVEAGLGGRHLDRLANTHLHSDHCGGNAALQAAYPQLTTSIPPGHAAQVASWDALALTYIPTGQQCPRFRFDELLRPGTGIQMGMHFWQVHAAKGHDPHSVVFFEPESSTLISADALWENGFGVVFPELEGADAFGDVGATLDLIEGLAPKIVIPGHGRVFSYSAGILDRARRRLDAMTADPVKHARHAAKVLLKFKLLEVQRIPFELLVTWAEHTAYFDLIRQRFFRRDESRPWIEELCGELIGAGAARLEGIELVNS